MTPERRAELRLCEDAVARTSYDLDRKHYMQTIAAQEARISSLESLLAECGEAICEAYTSCDCSSVVPLKKLANRIDAILPATEGDKNENS